jgi:predicted nucleic acid-binding protein
MGFSHLLDTSIFSQPIKDRPREKALDRWSKISEDRICTSAICLAELLQGLRERNSAKYWRRYREILEDRYPALPFDAATADTFGFLAADLRRRGNPRPVADLMIAATALQYGLVLATLNTRDFAGIPGLPVEDWNE